MATIVERSRTVGVEKEVPYYEVQVRDGYFTETCDLQEAESIKTEIESIEKNLTPLSPSQLLSIKEISSTTKVGSRYDSDEGDFYPVKMNVKRFSTPLGVVESWGYSLHAEWTIGRGTPCYPGCKEYDETNSMATACKMNYAPEFTVWWKPNTCMSVAERYINTNEVAVLDRVMELLHNII